MSEARVRYWNARRITVAVALSAVFFPLGAWVGAATRGKRMIVTDSLEAFNLADLRVPAKSLAKGAPIDGIPALSLPRVVTPGQAPYLQPDDLIIGLVIHGEARAYPLRLLTWHEVINDELGGEPIAVVYSPLCESVTVFDRRVAGEVLTFGVSGYLHESNVLMYDRTYHALWSQLGFSAMSGPFAGANLYNISGWRITTLAGWTDAWPETTVVSDQTRYQRDYTASPYADYLASDDLMFPVSSTNSRLPRKRPVIGVLVGRKAVAYPLDAVRAAGGLVRDKVGVSTITVRAEEDGSVSVAASAGAAVAHSFWFAWSAFHPHTEVWNAGDEDHLPND